MRFTHYRQFSAATVSSLTAFMAGSAYVWITPLLPRLREPGAEVYLSTDDASWVVSFIEIGNLVTPIPGAVLSDRIGRKPLLLSTAPMYVLSWIIVLFTRNVECLFITRVVQGMGLGLVYTILPMYLAEISQPAWRGVMSIFFIGMWFLGIFSIYCIGPRTSYQQLTWYCVFPPVIFASIFWYFPESPHFYLMRGKIIESEKALMWLRGKSDITEIEEEMQTMIETADNKNKASWKDLIFTKPGRKSLIIVHVVVMSQIMAGFLAIITFATDTFVISGDTLIEPDISTVTIGAITLLVTLISAGLVDRAGRRPIIITSAAGSFVCLTLIAIYFFIHQSKLFDMSAWTWVPYALIYTYVGVMNFGLAALLPTLEAELFTDETRGIACGIVTTNMCIMSFIVLISYLEIQHAIGLYLNYVIYACFALLGTILLSVMLPETKGKTFQEIHDLL